MADNKKKILLVDDEKLILRLTRTTLAGEGLEIFEADCGEKALEMARGLMPDLVILDINLPDIDGFEICKQIKSDPKTNEIKVIILTGLINENLKEMGRQAGADSLFNKPFSPIELLNKIRKLILSPGEDDFDESNNDQLASGEIPVPQVSGVFRTPRQLEEMKGDQLLIYATDLARLHHQELDRSHELKAAYAKLKEMEKMKDIFIALVSHELKTPLSIIKGYLYLLQEVLNKATIEQDVSGFMNPITKATDRLENLIGELLDFSRMKSGLMTFEKKEINVPDFLKLCLNDFKSIFDEKKIQIVLEAENTFRPIKADHERLKEAFSHFIRNALNFTPPGGKFKVRYRDEGIWVEVHFIDNGVGISQDKLDKVFNPFYQTADYMTRAVGGMGLGLPIAKHIIEDHGGNIRVESTHGEGTTFIIRLPRSYQDAKEIVAELKQTYPKQIEELSKNLKATQQQLLSYSQQLSGMYAREKQRTEQLEETLNELERTFIKTLAALSRMVDIKDAYTSNHTDRVSFYAIEIAKKLNPELLNDRNFKYSLLLHDIGKIGITEEILGKVGKLSDEELHILRAHSEKSVEILKDVEYLAPALNAIRSHHERWDGKGYPDGLKAEEIPLSARIIAVADSFDAMTTDRPYRKGLSLEIARGEIESHAGDQFDPEVVRCFLETWVSIEAYALKAKKIKKLEKDILNN